MDLEYKYASKAKSREFSFAPHANASAGEVQSGSEVFKMLVETIKEEHKLTPDNIKNDDDWRTMDEDKWEKLIEHIDKFLDDYKEQLEHLKDADIVI